MPTDLPTLPTLRGVTFNPDRVAIEVDTGHSAAGGCGPLILALIAGIFFSKLLSAAGLDMPFGVPLLLACCPPLVLAYLSSQKAHVELSDGGVRIVARGQLGQRTTLIPGPLLRLELTRDPLVTMPPTDRWTLIVYTSTTRLAIDHGFTLNEGAVLVDALRSMRACPTLAAAAWQMKFPWPTACATCRYDLRALTTPRCPECGTPFAQSAIDDWARQREAEA